MNDEENGYRCEMDQAEGWCPEDGIFNLQSAAFLSRRCGTQSKATYGTVVETFEWVFEVKTCDILDLSGSEIIRFSL